MTDHGEAQAELSGVDAVVGAVELRERLGLSAAEAVRLVTPAQLEEVLHAGFAGDAGAVLTTGVGASPGAAVGSVYFTADDAFDAFARGEEVILVKQETSPEDIHGMEISNGILTTGGGLASHAAVVARGWGIPAVVGAADLVIGDAVFTVGTTEVRQGDVISLDGGTGDVRVGEVTVLAAEPPPELDTLLAWCDEVRGDRLAIRTNADTAADAARARAHGAQGIGLCRTEHMFLGDRLPVVQRMILAESAAEEEAALKALGDLQRSDFVELLEAMDGLPVTIRLLDPPLHEFLPGVEEIVRGQITPPASAEERRLLTVAAEWHEQNPMLGTRGVRLAIIKTGLYRMQVRALAQAVIARAEAGGDPRIEIMIPLVVNRQEVALLRSRIEDELDAVIDDEALRSHVLIGTMIETPRAALCAAEIAADAEFFSFGTNDLTQMTFGFSRDDVERRLIPAYLELGLLDVNPFESLDQAGVGALVASAVDAGRAARPDLKVGVCGEHGGDPASIVFFVAAGLDYVSCSPFRVPVARLAAAQALSA